MIIRVNSFSLKEKIVIFADSEKNSFTCDGKEVDYSFDRFLYVIQDLYVTWPNKLIDEKIVDGKSYKIIIKNKTDKKVFEFINKFPKNIHSLEKLIKEIKNARTK